MLTPINDFYLISLSKSTKAYNSTLIEATDLNLISAKARHRIEQRRNWARLWRDEHERRMAELKAQEECKKREQEAVELKRKKESVLVNEMVQEIYRMNPEFAARRQGVLQVSYIASLWKSLSSEHLYHSYRSGKRRGNEQRSSRRLPELLSLPDRYIRCSPLNTFYILGMTNISLQELSISRSTTL